MKILSDPEKDVRNSTHQSGGYEWWYFDGISADGKHSFVVIFYEGNPFSTRYNKALEDGVRKPMPHEHPAISISVYEDGSPIYYSFTEFAAADCEFSEDQPSVKIGPHAMSSEVDDQLIYKLELDEKLPNGDTLEALLTFKSQRNQNSIFTRDQKSPSGHLWNLVQPRAMVAGTIRLKSDGVITKEIDFRGSGYHDHNRGKEPMKDEFTDWYWGRFHFDAATLTYYVMNRQNNEQRQAWLISEDNAEILDIFDEIDLTDKGLSIFGLSTARKIGLKSNRAKVIIQQSRLLDNGPFYQRFRSEAFLRIAEESVVESTAGISEYIRPKRIYARIFWPFVNMRIHYKSEGPHWVQRSKKLYRWTW
jgi:carotenoid 1,2-hydratase